MLINYSEIQKKATSNFKKRSNGLLSTFSIFIGYHFAPTSNSVYYFSCLYF